MISYFEANFAKRKEQLYADIIQDLDRHGPCSVRELSRRSLREYHTLHKALNKMADEKRIRRVGLTYGNLWQDMTLFPGIKANTRDGLPVCRSVWDLARYA